MVETLQAAYEPTYENLYNLVKEAGDPQHGWKVYQKKGDISLISKKYKGFPLKAVVARCVIKAPPELCFARYWDDDSKADWNPKLMETTLISEPSPDHRVLYQSVKVPWPLDNRDFVFEHKHRREPDGSFFAWAHSIDLPGWPKRKKIVRAHMYFSCGHFEPIRGPNGETWTRNSSCFMFDPKGLIPAWAINVSSGQFTDIVSAFRDCVMRDLATPPDERRVRLPYIPTDVNDSPLLPTRANISGSRYNTLTSEAGASDDFQTCESFSEMDNYRTQVIDVDKMNAAAAAST